MTRALAPRALLLLAALLAGPCAAADEPPGPGLPPGREPAAETAAAPEIASVSFQVASPYRISHEELVSLVTVRPGARLTEDAVRNSIRGLYAKALFREISAYVRPDGGRVHLLFFLRPAPVVSDVEVVGVKALTAAQVSAASRIRRGIPLEDRNLAEYEKAVLELLRKKGFLSATVKVSALCLLETGGGKVRIDVAEGRPATVRSLNLPGASFFPMETSRSTLGVKIGEPFDFEKWDRGVGKLRGAYKRAGFLNVHISEPQVPCESGSGACLSALVEEGARYDVRWEVSGPIPVRDLEKASGLYGTEEVTEGGMAFDVRDRLLAFLRQKDHLRADVTVELGDKTPAGRPMKIAVREGPEGRIREIRFAGNAGIRSKDLRKQMTTAEKGPFSFLTGSGRYREDEWNADLAAIVGLYQKEGYVLAHIAGVDNSWDDAGGITETIRIEEGKRFVLREIRFRGSDHFLRSELLALMGNREGKHVDYVALEHDQEAIGAHLRNAGFLDAKVSGELAFDEGKDTAVALIDVVEGPRYRLGNLILRGNQLTESVVVRRELTLRPGEFVGEKSLLEFQQALFRTGLFKSVRVQRVKRPGEGIVDLIVEVDETMFFEVEFGAGYGTDTGIRGFVGATDRNLDGKGRTLAGRVTLSQKEQRYEGTLREPWVFGSGWKWDGAVTGSYQEVVRESFSLRKASILTSVTKTVFERSSVSVQYEVSREHTFNVSPGAIISPEDQGGANIAAGRTLFVLDLRDDAFNPKRGALNSGTVELASYVFGSEVDYYKLAGQSSWYFPVLRRNTLALSLRAGMIRPMRDTPEVPIQKRFFLGGRTTVRGFPEEGLGPKGLDGKPIGGDFMFNGNAEIRVPIAWGFLVAGFFDVGSVWFRHDPENDFDLRKSAGLGFRYVTPIGPVSFDYGWKIDRRTGETPAEWHFTIGAVF